MCGIAGIAGPGADRRAVDRMVAVQHHRGPDANGVYADPSGAVVLGHDRLSIIDRSAAGRQPMSSHDGRLCIVFNGEVYNYLELRAQLSDYPYRTKTDTEVVLAAYERWGDACLDRFVGMFAFMVWDRRTRRLFAARDRFGVKPLYYHEEANGTLVAASEITALHAAGVEPEPDPVAWSTYLTYGLLDHSDRTFWRGVRTLPGGHSLAWKDGRLSISRWYDVAERAASIDERPIAVVEEEYLALLRESVRLRFRSDVPVGINLSGGLDSSTLLATVQSVQGHDSDVKAFTFVTGDPAYDELPWVERMLAQTRHPLLTCRLDAADVPALAESVHAHEHEPFGGLPTLAYARLFERAREEGVIVLLDGQGMDEQWAGYDYYRASTAGDVASVQGTTRSAARPECLMPEFKALADPPVMPAPFADRLRNLQYRDTRFTKIPRALRFSDRVSMRASTELREPFLDHRLFELAFRQPADRKIRDGSGKWLLRRIVDRLLPEGVATAPKRPMQTPQREWLRGPLFAWSHERIEEALARFGGTWLNAGAVRASLKSYRDIGDESSFHLWQWIGLGLGQTAGDERRKTAPVAAAISTTSVS